MPAGIWLDFLFSALRGARGRGRRKREAKGQSERATKRCSHHWVSQFTGFPAPPGTECGKGPGPEGPSGPRRRVPAHLPAGAGNAPGPCGARGALGRPPPANSRAPGRGRRRRAPGAAGTFPPELSAPVPERRAGAGAGRARAGAAPGGDRPPPRGFRPRTFATFGAPNAPNPLLGWTGIALPRGFLRISQTVRVGS